MSKLTERLRQCPYMDEYPAIMDEAAERIEHLERVLVQAREALLLSLPADVGQSVECRLDERAAHRQSIAAIDEALK